ncbi:MAG: TetR/AcrR family transcriptional regulator [Ketobacteraceae bacterium]|nr:TetR/AcrR family transcriptional regulator [Ketobacteraceae bacterium]
MNTANATNPTTVAAMRKAFWQDEEPAESRRERRKQEIRNKIIEAAISLFEEKGIEETTLEDICETADISRPTFYSYYPSRQELILALVEKLWLNVAGEITRKAVAKDDSTQSFVGAFLKGTRQEIARYGRLERELIRHSMNQETGDHTQNSTMLKAMTGMFVTVYTEGRKRGDIGNRFPVDFLAEASMGCISSVMMNWAFDENYPVERRLKQTSDLIIAMISLQK